MIQDAQFHILFYRHIWDGFPNNDQTTMDYDNHKIKPFEETDGMVVFHLNDETIMLLQGVRDMNQQIIFNKSTLWLKIKHRVSTIMTWTNYEDYYARACIRHLFQKKVHQSDSTVLLNSNKNDNGNHIEDCKDLYENKFRW